MNTKSICTQTLLVVLSFVPLVSAQMQAPMTDDDVLTLVREHQPESSVVSQIKSRANKFDTSPHEIIRLNKAGVTENELNAMIAANSKESSANDMSPTPASKSHVPHLYLQRAGALQELPLEKTQLAQTKTKPASMKGLASDSAVTQAMQSGIGTASWEVATHVNSGIAGSATQEGGSVFSSVLSHRTPDVTYVWGVPAPASANILQTVSPSFSLDFSRVIGVQADDYEPAIVKLTPAQNLCRVVGATQGKADARSSVAADWQVYSHFLEERVPAHAEKLMIGKYKLSAASELQPGEYAVVLRPASTSKKFSGGDVARAQGDGLMFDAIWTFQIADSAE